MWPVWHPSSVRTGRISRPKPCQDSQKRHSKCPEISFSSFRLIFGLCDPLGGREGSGDAGIRPVVQIKDGGGRPHRNRRRKPAWKPQIRPGPGMIADSTAPLHGSISTSTIRPSRFPLHILMTSLAFSSHIRMPDASLSFRSYAAPSETAKLLSEIYADFPGT